EGSAREVQKSNVNLNNMDLTPTSTSSPEGIAPAAAPPPPPPGILADRWPSLSRAMSQYHQGVAEQFSRMAYDRVDAGLIRLEDRHELAAEADELGIKAFDAQLLIACAIRQWVLDREYDPRPSPHAPALSFEYKSFRRTWRRIALLLGTIVALDALILWRWLF